MWLMMLFIVGVSRLRLRITSQH